MNSLLLSCDSSMGIMASSGSLYPRSPTSRGIFGLLWLSIPPLASRPGYLGLLLALYTPARQPPGVSLAYSGSLYPRPPASRGIFGLLGLSIPPLAGLPGYLGLLLALYTPALRPPGVSLASFDSLYPRPPTSRGILGFFWLSIPPPFGLPGYLGFTLALYTPAATAFPGNQ